jgi:NAD(P)H-flavin reductase/hemoglobin-like flavoprotein
VDIARLKSSFARIAMHGDEVPLHFYSDLFLKHPETRLMFPISMQAQRAHLVDALARIVSSVDTIDELTAFLQNLGRDHRKFGTLAPHYDAVGASLLATFEHFSGDAWDTELEADWRAAYQLVASVMTAAAHEDEQLRPAFWSARVVACERLAFDITSLTVQTRPRLDYQPGQSAAIESPRRPRLWRYYSMANAPREDRTIEFHVRLIDGGPVSMALTTATATGDELRLGPPVGALRFDAASGRDVLLVAGSTGLAPLKAILEQIAALRQQPRVHLFFGARTPDGLYDLNRLEKMAAGCSWLTVTPAAATARGQFPGQVGMLAEVVARLGDWTGHDAYLAGPTEMIQDCTAVLAAAGVPGAQIHVEDFGWSER